MQSVTERDSTGSTVCNRRRFLAGVTVGLSAVGLGVGGVAAEQHTDTVTVSLDNVGSSAWEVTAVDDDDDVAPLNTENPTLQLQVGTRYIFENGGWNFHPLAFRDADDESLLSQDDDDGGNGGGGDDGPYYSGAPSATPLSSHSFADDPDVDWRDDGDEVAFTLTEELAAELDSYICTVHSSMVGDISIVEADDDTDDTGDGDDDDMDDGDTNDGDGDDGDMDDGDTSDGDLDDGDMDDGDTSDDSNGTDSTADGDGPGFGAGAGMAGLAGLAAYALRRVRSGTETDS